MSLTVLLSHATELKDVEIVGGLHACGGWRVA